jgi:hypothetical protein
VSAYSFVLFLHFCFLILAMAAFGVLMLASLQIRNAVEIPEIARWGGFIHTVVPLFPVAAIGLFGTGAYMTSDRWTWSTSWVVAAIVGLAMIVISGEVLDGGRGRALEHELKTNGLSERALRLRRDPIGWSAKMTTITLVVAVVYIMSNKPGAAGAIAALAVAVLVGVAVSVPFWRTAEERPAAVSEPAG